MEFRSLKYVAEACEGELLGDAAVKVNRVGSDSRSAQPGEVFFAIAGDRFDGHDFLQEVAAKGVAAVVVDRKRVPKNVTCAVIAVDNPRQALGRLAARYRTDFDLPVIAVGGSNGKTSTKELVASVLRQKFKTVWSEASFNNDIGVPATLLKLGSTHQAAVLEVGTNHPGELAPLVKMIQPRFGIITSIGREHLEFFGNLAGVCDEEGWLAELLPADGKLFLNGDLEWVVERISSRTKAKIIKIGLKPANDWSASDIKMDVSGAKFQVKVPRDGFSGEYRIRLLGNHQVANSLFVIAVGAELGLSREEIEQGLTVCQPAKMRLNLWNWNGVCVLDDAYNANADSMAAALETLSRLECAGRRVAVLGDMGELGEHSQAAHEEVGRCSAELGVNKLFAVGKMASVMAKAARDAGLENVSEFIEPLDAVSLLKEFLKPGDVLLLKASRATRLERLSEALKSPNAAGKV